MTLSQQISELAGEITPGGWIAAASDTHDKRLAIWADGGMAGAAQIALLPPEFASVKANASLIVTLRNNLPAIIAALELAERLEAPGADYDVAIAIGNAGCGDSQTIWDGGKAAIAAMMGNKP